MSHRRRTPRLAAPTAVSDLPILALEPRLLLSAAITAQVPNQSLATQQITLLLSNYFDDSAVTGSGTIVDMQTNLPAPDNNIPLQLTDSATPTTVANFLSYLNSGAYNGAVIDRSIPGFVIQGGGYDANGDAIPANGPIASEAASATLKNTAGTIAMALSTGPNTATNQWFFNLADNPQLDNTSDGGPFTAFGQVFDNGMNVLQDIAALPTVDVSSSIPAWTNLPVQNYTSGNEVAESNLVTVDPVVVVDPLTYYATSSNMGVAVPEVIDNQLSLTAPASASGTSTITVSATDLSGDTVTQTFTVTVGATSTGGTGTGGTGTGGSGGTTTSPTPVVNTSPIVPSVVRDTLPSDLIAGTSRGEAIVELQNTGSATETGNATLDLYASPLSSVYAAPTPLGSVVRRIALKPHALLTLAVPIPTIPSTLDGGYDLLAKITDPAGDTATSSAGPAFTAAPPTVSFSETVVRSTLISGSIAGQKTPAVVQLKITNTGNIASSGQGSITLGLADSAGDSAVIRTVAEPIALRPRASREITIPLLTLPSVSAGDYFVVAQLSADQTGASAANSGPAYAIAAPLASLIPTIVSNARIGSASHPTGLIVTLKITNAGNYVPSGSSTIALTVNTAASSIPLKTQQLTLAIAPGKSRTIQIRLGPTPGVDYSGATLNQLLQVSLTDPLGNLTTASQPLLTA